MPEQAEPLGERLCLKAAGSPAGSLPRAVFSGMQREGPGVPAAPSRSEAKEQTAEPGGLTSMGKSQVSDQ